MANIVDYTKWRGDLDLQEFEFNEIDNLILSRFSYFPFENILGENEEVTIKKLSKRFKKEDKEKLVILWDDDIDLFALMGDSKRYGNLKATKYINKISIESEQQFSAITVLLPDDTMYISYRGTDNTIVAWKEDFNMCIQNNLPSQVEAVKYLDKIAKKYPDKKIRIGGHSKGGNLAMYAGIFIDDKNIKNRIINIYNNDGPGFDKEIINSKEYKNIINKIDTYIPQDSVFGKLLNNEGNYIVVKSNKKGIMQHDVYTWQIIDNKFETLNDVTDWSKLVDKSIKDWFNKIDEKQKKEVIDIIFDILYATEVDTFEEIGKDWLNKSKIILKSYKNLDKETKKMITKTLTAFVKVTTFNWTKELKITKKIKEKV